MNGLREQLAEVKGIAEGLREFEGTAVVGLCVPSTLLYVATTLAEDTELRLGAQDCHPDVSGAHTGDVSAEMIADCFARLCIVGHSERRADHGENNELVRRKAQACLRADLIPIVCIGETAEENAAGRTAEVVGEQLNGSLPEAFGRGEVIVAYEPVWAIGSGRVPEAKDVERVHTDLRGLLDAHGAEGASSVPLLYGGSVKAGNAAELMAANNVDGALVGGASLQADEFLGICREAIRGMGGQSRSGS